VPYLLEPCGQNVLECRSRSETEPLSRPELSHRGGCEMKLSCTFRWTCLDFTGLSGWLAPGSAFTLASRGSHDRAACKGRWLPRRGSDPSLMHTDLIDFLLLRILSIYRYVYSCLLRSYGSLARRNDGPDTARALDPWRFRRGRSR